MKRTIAGGVGRTEARRVRGSLLALSVGLAAFGCAHDGALRAQDRQVLRLESQVATLEEEGVEKFEASFESLLEGIDEKLSAVGAR